MSLLNQIKTVRDLKRFVDQTMPLYFDRCTMEYFGDTMSNFRVEHTDKGTDMHCVVLIRKYETPKGAPSGAISIWKEVEGKLTRIWG